MNIQRGRVLHQAPQQRPLDPRRHHQVGSVPPHPDLRTGESSLGLLHDDATPYHSQPPPLEVFAHGGLDTGTVNALLSLTERITRGLSTADILAHLSSPSDMRPLSYFST